MTLPEFHQEFLLGGHFESIGFAVDDEDIGVQFELEQPLDLFGNITLRSLSKVGSRSPSGYYKVIKLAFAIEMGTTVELPQGDNIS